MAIRAPDGANNYLKRASMRSHRLYYVPVWLCVFLRHYQDFYRFSPEAECSLLGSLVRSEADPRFLSYRPPRCGLLWVPVAVQLPPPIIRRPSWTSDFFAINSINRVFNGMTQTTLGIDNLFWPHPKIAQIAKAPSLYWPIIPRILSIQMTR